MESIWTKTADKRNFEQLEGETKTDILIIGGGIAGLTCCYMLKSAGIDCILVEANRICQGITKNTTAKITAQHGLIYEKIARKYGDENAYLYYKAQNDALECYKNLCDKCDCDFEIKDSYVYSISKRSKLEKEMAVLEKIGCKAEFTEKTELPFAVSGAVRFTGQAQFHPLKFAYWLAEDLPIYENTKVLEMGKNEVVTNRGKIRAKKVIVATHFPFINKHGGYFLKMYQHRSYEIALKNAVNINGMYVDEDIKGMSFRDYNGLLLLGGGSHRTGKKGGNWKELRSFAAKSFAEAREVCHWATQDCMTLDGMAYIGQYSKNTPNMFVATGFNKWGMTASMVSAILLTDLIMGKENEYATLFSPMRSMYKPQLMVNAFEAVTGLLCPTVPRCPHMKCALKYNPQERSWDCSCHGSRFEESGKLIDNPATDDKK